MNLRQPHTQRGIAGILLVIVLIWLIFFTSYLPFSPKRTSDQLARFKDELQLTAGELQRAKSVAESIPRLQMELSQMQSKWESLKSLLPKATDMSKLLTEVTTSGLRAGVQFTLFEPQPPEPAELYTRYPIKVTVNGGYHQVGGFFDNICNMERLVGISDVKLAQFEKGQTTSTVEATVTISAYTYNEEPRKIEQPQASPNQKAAAKQPTKKPKE
ncbi:MAG: type 4a pilus biogenesis protein PilO [Candidatus Eisenbacteria bacterium]